MTPFRQDLGCYGVKVVKNREEFVEGIFFGPNIYPCEQEEESWKCTDCLSGVIVCTLCGHSEGETNAKGRFSVEFEEQKNNKGDHHTLISRKVWFRVWRNEVVNWYSFFSQINNTYIQIQMQFLNDHMDMVLWWIFSQETAVGQYAAAVLTAAATGSTPSVWPARRCGRKAASATPAWSARRTCATHAPPTIPRTLSWSSRRSSSGNLQGLYIPHQWTPPYYDFPPSIYQTSYVVI